MTKRWASRIGGVVGIAAVVMATTVGCGGEDDPAPAPTTTSAPTSAADTSSSTAKPPPSSPEGSTTVRVDPPSETTEIVPPPVEAPVTEDPVQQYTEDADPPAAAGAVTVGQNCDSPSMIGTDVNTGADIVCVYMGAGGGYVWVDSAPIAGVNNPGDPCDSTTDQVSSTPEGKAIMCVNGTWVYGP